MLITALTGGIASGKSVAAQVFTELGCYVNYADQTAHDLMLPGQPAWDKIVNHFGAQILHKDKTIDRTSLAKRIFKNPDDRQFINTLLHPLVMAEKQKIIASLREKRQYKIFISEAALIIEAGFLKEYDKIIVTYCKPEIQIERLCQRDNIPRAEALQRMKTQMAPEQKTKYADYIIDTSGPIAETIEQSERIYRNLMLDYLLLYGNIGRK